MEVATKPQVQSVIELAELCFAYPQASSPVIDIPSFSIRQGEQVFLMGPSGSGKTTLLGLLAGILKPQHGSVSVLGTDITTLGNITRDRFRADHIGFIFQMFNLIPYLSVVENIILPCHFSALRKQRALEHSPDLKTEALRLLTRLNLHDKQLLKKPVVELSIGQQQRVAAARALMGAPELLIADEPTSSLDRDHRQAFINLLFEECKAATTTLIFVSHDTSLADLFHRRVRLDDLNNSSKTLEPQRDKA